FYVTCKNSFFMKTTLSLLFFWIFIQYSKSSVAAPLISKTSLQSNVTNNNLYYDSLALVNLYNSTQGNQWTNNANWLSSNPINTWYGVKMSSDGSKLTELHLYNNNLVGKIDILDRSFQDLAILDLSYNHISGFKIEPYILFGSLFNLYELVLSGNQLTSLDIPPNFIFSNLNRLYLNSNPLNTLASNINFYSQPSYILTTMPYLFYLDLSNTTLNSLDIPDNSMNQLFFLYLNNTSFQSIHIGNNALNNFYNLDLGSNSTVQSLSIGDGSLNAASTINFPPNLTNFAVGVNSLSSFSTQIFTMSIGNNGTYEIVESTKYNAENWQGAFFSIGTGAPNISFIIKAIYPFNLFANSNSPIGYFYLNQSLGQYPYNIYGGKVIETGYMFDFGSQIVFFMPTQLSTSPDNIVQQQAVSYTNSYPDPAQPSIPIYLNQIYTLETTQGFNFYEIETSNQYFVPPDVADNGSNLDNVGIGIYCNFSYVLINSLNGGKKGIAVTNTRNQVYTFSSGDGSSTSSIRWYIPFGDFGSF
ncbi:MAG: hypothetical protein QM535_22115, partial [Limnohabitans sp.]|nr:hypothetical protein [Limnohabitans sp.]